MYALGTLSFTARRSQGAGNLNFQIIFNIFKKSGKIKILFTIVAKKIKYLGTNLTNQDVHPEND